MTYEKLVMATCPVCQELTGASKYAFMFHVINVHGLTNNFICTYPEYMILDNRHGVPNGAIPVKLSTFDGYWYGPILNFPL